MTQQNKQAHTEQLNIRTFDWGLPAALIIPLLAILPLFTFAGLPNTADGPAHLMRQVELNQAWAEGNFYPRWGTDLALGHGMPIFSYAPPLLYQATQLFHLTGLPLDASLKAVIVAGFLLYSVGMFLFARRVYGPYPALVAAAAYVYTPYRLREAYIQGNYGQFLGLAFYPLIFWAFHGLITDGRLRYWLAAPLALAGLLFSHNISFMLFVPVFAAYLLFLILLTAYQTNRRVGESATNSTPPPSNKLRAPALPSGSRTGAGVTQYAIRNTLFLLLRATVAGLLGLGLAAIFWLPAFGERHHIKLEGITQGFFDFRENFISLPEFLSPPLPLDRGAINPEFPLSLGLPQIIAATAALLLLLIFAVKQLRPNGNSATNTTKQTSRLTPHASQSPLAHTLFFAAFLLLYGFLALPYSQILWENVPLIELAEFPWRMLGPAIFCAGVPAAALLWLAIYLFDVSNKMQPIITVGLLIIIIALNGHYLYPEQFIRWGTPTPADAFAYEVTSGAIGTTSTGEFLPRGARQHPQPDTFRPDYEAGRPPQILAPDTLPDDASVEMVSHRSEADTLLINTPQEFVATLRALYWPGWAVYLDGQTVPFKITPDTGLIQTTIPAGQHTLTLRLESTPLRTAGLWLTLLSLVALAGIFITAKISGRSKKNESANERINDNHAPRITPHTSRLTPRFLALAAVILIALYFISQPLAPLFTLQSNPDAPAPAEQQVQVDFSDQLRLTGFDNWPQEIEMTSNNNTELTTVLYWRALQDIDTNYSIFLHLDAPNGQTFATVDEVNPEDIPTRNWPPGLYLRNVLHMQIPANVPPIRYKLTTGVYNRETGERLPPAGNEETAFNLGSLWLTGPPANTPAAQLAVFGEQITLRHATLAGNNLALGWQASQPVTQNYSIFVHVLDAGGALLGQADGTPYNGLYPLPNWLPGQLIEDNRTLEFEGQPAALSIGLYNPATGQRLPATDSAGQPLPDNSFTLPVTP